MQARVFICIHFYVEPKRNAFRINYETSDKTHKQEVKSTKSGREGLASGAWRGAEAKAQAEEEQQRSSRNTKQKTCL